MIRLLLLLPLVCCLVMPTFATELVSVASPDGGQSGTTSGGDGGGARDWIVWDNGDTDGSNGYSNAAKSTFGYKRSLLDDFVVDSSFVINGLHTYQIWDTLPPGSGTDFELRFRVDNAGTPGDIIGAATTSRYAETATGRYWFGRPEYRMDCYFHGPYLGPGRYWIEGNVIGPENNFWMVTSAVTGSECWLNYEDYGLMPGTELFGAPADLAFYLTSWFPEPSTLALLAVGGFVLLRRR
ncbi:MAG: PEP-CTERM sorting domain-containing protein [Planctomycetes bacterium]|nr:PEP-CTERM sorting domain-containing protein [Planctomycetota bacterium]